MTHTTTRELTHISAMAQRLEQLVQCDRVDVRARELRRWVTGARIEADAELPRMIIAHRHDHTLTRRRT
jgi:hypothetical protein